MLILCRSRKDGHKVRCKVESSSSEAKLVRTGAERKRVFPTRLEKGTNGLSFSALEGKIEQRIRISARKRLCCTVLSKQLCSPYDKHLNPPPPTPENDEIGKMDNRSQERWAHFLYIIQKSNTDDSRTSRHSAHGQSQIWQSDWLRIRNAITLRMLGKLDLPRGRDSWYWSKGARPLGTRMSFWMNNHGNMW